jgi:cytochrome c oxidase subunit II
MPPRVRRRIAVVALLVLGVALTATGLAAAANGGFTPQHAHSPNVHNTNLAYYVILGFTTAIFIIVETALIVFLWKYRARGRARTAEGDQLHGHTRLEIIWTVIPVIILAAIATTIFLLLPGINPPNASAADRVDITVEGHMFYWQFNYPNGARTINDLYVPVDKEVRLTVISSDVVHSWWVPQLQGKIQAIPGRENTTWFKADRAGTYYGQCAIICGPYHAAMKARVIALDESEYTSYIDGQAAKDLGKSEWNGVCAVCHGPKGEGGYGPALASNSTITQRKALEVIVRNGRNKMPPVGNTWTDEQLDALIAYAKSKIYKGASTSGG